MSSIAPVYIPTFTSPVEAPLIATSFKEQIELLRSRIAPRTISKASVVILGAGPAGLLRAIEAVMHGNPVQVIEKRSEGGNGRINTVALTEAAISKLKDFAVYQYLLENSLIDGLYKDGSIHVRLTDLELAMKEVLSRLSPDPVITYDATVTAINDQAEKIAVVIASKGEELLIKDVDILVNTEGSRSTTNALLGIDRIQVLPSFPVVAAIYRDIRPKITGAISAAKYVGRSMGDIARTIYYQVQLIFLFIVLKNFRRQIIGAVTLSTPKQAYLGGAFSDGINARILTLQGSYLEKKRALEKASTPDEIARCKKDLKSAEAAYWKFASRWLHLSLAMANLIAILLRSESRYRPMALHRSLKKFEVVMIGADRAAVFSKRIKGTFVLLAGDAAATVDPATGLGCNTAISTGSFFTDLLSGFEEGSIDKETLLLQYENRMAERTKSIHHESKRTRAQYRPQDVSLIG
ncbi:MAG: FAD-dependent monooxygenase [Verrucomicrobia bacterium]|nr:FAD-dependent monooxygenase [Verrucomicrobiota bacterium]